MRFNSNTRPIRQKQFEHLRDKPGMPPPPMDSTMPRFKIPSR
jgi:hypothetical protein